MSDIPIFLSFKNGKDTIEEWIEAPDEAIEGVQVTVDKNNEKKFSGFLGWLYNFLNFKVFTIELILKVTYVCLAIYLTLSSFALIGTSFIAFLICIIGGNIALRVTYELLMLLVSICTNVSEINKKLKSKENKGE